MRIKSQRDFRSGPMFVVAGAGFVLGASNIVLTAGSWRVFALKPVVPLSRALLTNAG